jgi:hypothetical protein
MYQGKVAWANPLFPYVELSDVPRLQQVEKKAVGRQSTWNLLVLNIGMEEMKFVEHKINFAPPPGSSN